MLYLSAMNRKFFQVPVCHSHGRDVWSDAAVIGSLITDDGTFSSVYDESDITLDAEDFNISFVSGKNAACFVVIWIHERLHTEDRCLTVISNPLVWGPGCCKGLSGLVRPCTVTAHG